VQVHSALSFESGLVSTISFSGLGRMDYCYLRNNVLKSHS